MASGIVVVGEHEFFAAMDVTIEAANIAARNIVYKGGEIIRTNAKKEFIKHIQDESLSLDMCNNVGKDWNKK